MPKASNIQTLTANKIYAYSAILLLIAGYVGSLTIPDFLQLISQEDHLLENLTTGLLLGTAFFGFMNWKQKQRNTNAVATCTAYASIGFLDEVSFGQRLIGFTPPMAGGTSLDGFHDLANMLKKVISINLQYHPAQTFTLFVLLALTLAVIAIRRRSNLSNTFYHLKRLGLSFTILSIVSAIIISQLLDLKIIALPWSTPLEEILELISALGLLTCMAIAVKDNIPK